MARMTAAQIQELAFEVGREFSRRHHLPPPADKARLVALITAFDAEQEAAEQALDAWFTANGTPEEIVWKNAPANSKNTSGLDRQRRIWVATGEARRTNETAVS